LLTTPYSFVICQVGAESTIKSSICEPNGPFRLSFSRPGFVTLKSDLAIGPWSKAIPTSPFIRIAGHAFEKCEFDTAEELAATIIDKYGNLDFQSVHVWQRDAAAPGWHNFEPGVSPLADSVAQVLQSKLESNGDLRHKNVNTVSPIDSRVLDIVGIDSNVWWIGTHLVQETYQGWPGGVLPILPPKNMISRAYLKMAEALAWSRLPIEVGDAVVEIGSSPGGASQRLLDLGLQVTGIDPAEMAEEIMNHPDFTYIQGRSLQIKRRFFAKFRWLVCDANVAPNYTLDTVEAIVTHPSNKLKGLLLTIKLSEWELATELPDHLARVQSWGFTNVRARQLSFNRREYCLAANR
jgi:23S rRNA (cytidine2498-2'-O)-methyltransferase